MPETIRRLVNVRDVGAASRLLRRGVLFRSDAPLPGDAPPGLPGWPPRTVLDLRAVSEAAHAHPFAPFARVVNLPLLGSRPPGHGGWHERSLGDQYVWMLGSQIGPTIVEAITVLAESERPVLVHCTAGKDRTGVVIAVALHLVGVGREEVVADYGRTAAAMPQVLERMRTSLAELTAGAALAALPAHVLEANASALDGALGVLDDFDGGPLGWFQAHGGTGETVDRLRARLLVG